MPKFKEHFFSLETMFQTIKVFLSKQKVNALTHPPYSPDLSACDLMGLRYNRVVHLEAQRISVWQRYQRHTTIGLF